MVLTSPPMRPLYTPFLCALALATSLAAKPNFLFIIADDMTYRDIGCYGGQAHTPHIDHLATEGMRFERCFQAASMCSPTRHNLYTGLYPIKSGAYPNHTFAKAGTKSIAHYLKPLGYRVGLAGKSHVSPKSVFPFETVGGGNNPDLEAADRWIGEVAASDDAFCFFACSREPHIPWDKGDASAYPQDKVILPPYIPDTPVARDSFSRYLAEITYFDNQVGDLVALLDKHGLREDTMVMVLSEQGNAMPFAKWTCYGNGLQSAMIVRWPGQVAAGSTASALVEYSDVVPTFVEAAGGTPDSVLDGASFMGVLKGQTDRHKDYVFGQTTTRGINNGVDNFPIRTVRGERYRLIWNLNSASEYRNNAMTKDFYLSMRAAADSGEEPARSLLSAYERRPEWELYDCVADPLERDNLAADPEHASTVKRLKAQLDAWMEAQGDRGIETEMEAIYRGANAQGKTRAEVDAAWAKQRRNFQ